MKIPFHPLISVAVFVWALLALGCGVKGAPLPPIVVIPEKSDLSLPPGAAVPLPLSSGDKVSLDIFFKDKGVADEFQLSGALGETIQVVRPRFRYEITPDLLEKGKPQILIKTRIFKEKAKSKKPWKDIELVTLEGIGASFGSGFELRITPHRPSPMAPL